MIDFDLACKDASHVFEIWFGSSADYEDQKARGLVSCPYCGSADVDKAVMAPNVAAKGNSRSEPAPVATSANVPAAANVPTPGTIQGDGLEACRGAGEDARKLGICRHEVRRRGAVQLDGIWAHEQDVRPIHGQTSSEEARALIEEGVPVAPLLLPIRPPQDRQLSCIPDGSSLRLRRCPLRCRRPASVGSPKTPAQES